MQSWPTEIWGGCLNCVENGNNPEKSNCSAEGGVSFISEAKHPTVCKSEHPCEEEEESWELPRGLAERGCAVCIKHRSIVMKILCKIFQVAEWGSWCQISRGLVLAAAFRKLALGWCCWYPRGRTCVFLAPLCKVRHAQGVGRFSVSQK